MEGGFLNRCLTIAGEVRQWKAITPRPTGCGRFVWEIKDIHREYEDKDCVLQFTDDSAELWTNFYNEWKTARQKTTDRDRRLTARIDEHILKLAMVYSAIEKRTVISKAALTTAIKIGKWLQDVSLQAFSEVGKDSFSRAKRWFSIS